jgi:homocysteine S-methyltransferase
MTSSFAVEAWNPFLSKSLWILDGGLATELEERGFSLKTNLWSAELLEKHSDVIQSVHCDYFKAGSNVATTCSFQASVPGFMTRGYSQKEAESLLQKSIQVAYNAKRECLPLTKDAIIAVSIGPYGAYLADGSEFTGTYVDTYSLNEIRQFHQERLHVLLSSPSLSDDYVLALETMPAIQEVIIILDILSKDYKNVPVYVSFSCKDKLRTNHGETLMECALQVSKIPVNLVAIGVNCTNPIYVTSLLQSCSGQVPLLCYPNRGETWDPVLRKFIESTGSDAVSFAKLAREWTIPGVIAIGGCCRTTPEFIHQLCGIQQSKTQQLNTQSNAIPDALFSKFGPSLAGSPTPTTLEVSK